MKTLLKNNNEGCIVTFGKYAFKHKVRRSYKNTIRLLIADDHPHLISGLEKDLSADAQIRIIGTASSYDKLLETAERLQPNIVLLDLKMPGMEKYNLRNYIARLRAINHCKVVIFTNETGWARIYKCLEFGAIGYIEKAISFGKLALFIHKIHEDEEIIIYTQDKLPEMNFSDRQKEILHYLASGKENDEIAFFLGLGIKSVQSYIDIIRNKISDGIGIHPIRPRMLMFLASKFGFGEII